MAKETESNIELKKNTPAEKDGDLFHPIFLNFIFSLKAINGRAAYPQHLRSLRNVVAAQLQGFDDSLLLNLTPAMAIFRIPGAWGTG